MESDEDESARKSASQPSVGCNIISIEELPDDYFDNLGLAARVGSTRRNC